MLCIIRHFLVRTRPTTENLVDNKSVDSRKITRILPKSKHFHHFFLRTLFDPLLKPNPQILTLSLAERRGQPYPTLRFSLLHIFYRALKFFFMCVNFIYFLKIACRFDGRFAFYSSFLPKATKFPKN